jgi:hypothetical protein
MVEAEREVNPTAVAAAAAGRRELPVRPARDIDEHPHDAAVDEEQHRPREPGREHVLDTDTHRIPSVAFTAWAGAM